jgi:hypothetical protein
MDFINLSLKVYMKLITPPDDSNIGITNMEHLCLIYRISVCAIQTHHQHAMMKTCPQEATTVKVNKVARAKVWSMVLLVVITMTI